MSVRTISRYMMALKNITVNTIFTKFYLKYCQLTQMQLILYTDLISSDITKDTNSNGLSADFFGFSKWTITQTMKYFYF